MVLERPTEDIRYCGKIGDIRAVGDMGISLDINFHISMMNIPQFSVYCMIYDFVGKLM